MAVISAKNDYANQIILKKAQVVDPQGNRTLGIITKPDFLRAGSENESDWVALAQNKDIYFKLGWHMLKNRADGEAGGFEERNASEAAFFGKGTYAGLDRAVLGIETLRTRLSRTLSEHLRKELPGLKKELDRKLQETTTQLNLLGDSRATISDQKAFLTELGSKAADLFKSGVDGNYKQPFFRDVDPKANIDHGANVKRFRAVVQALNIAFARRMRLDGRKFTIVDNAVDDSGDEDDEDSENGKERASNGAHQNGSHDKPGRKKLTRPQAIEWVMRVQNVSRGTELPGNFNPMLISELFWEQSMPWEELAMEHINKVADACYAFVINVVRCVTNEEVEARLQAVFVEAALRDARAQAVAELQKILTDKSGQLITYNHYYTSTIQKARHNKQTKTFKKLIEQSKTNTGFGDTVNPMTLTKLIDGRLELDMDRFSSEEALDCMIAYYKQELKFFVDVVTKQVVERHLVKTLPQQVLSPVVIARLEDSEVSYIAAEPADVTDRRNHLVARQNMLKDGQETFRKAMGSLRF